MIEFILKGLLRDRHRSLLPVIVIALGVMMTTMLYGWLKGVSSDMLSTSSRIETGHVKVMTQEYDELASQVPIDLAVQGVSELLPKLSAQTGLEWAARIRFGGLLDIPDDQGETRSQGPIFGIALDILSDDTTEIERFDLAQSLQQGRLPQAPGELLVAADLLKQLKFTIGDTATFIGGTANGSMAIFNFVVVGSLHYGIPALDRNLVIADLGDIQYALDMGDAAAEILGFLPNGNYVHSEISAIKAEFAQSGLTDSLGSPLVMRQLTEQPGMAELYPYLNSFLFIIMGFMILFMGVILWNFGLMAGLRRYGEIGVRLAMGESKGEIVRWLIYESIVVGVIGSAIGTAIGMSFCYYLQVYGLDMSASVQGSSLLMSPVFRAEVTPEGFIIGFIPGILSVVAGTALSSVGVYHRSTASLFKELEA